MFLLFYCILLTLLQVILLIGYFIRRNDNAISTFRWSSLFTVLVDVLCIVYLMTSDYYNGWDGIGIFFALLIFIGIHGFIFVIGLIANTIRKQSMKYKNASEQSADTTTVQDISTEDSTNTTEESITNDKKAKKFTLVPKITPGSTVLLIILIISAILTFSSETISNKSIIKKQDNKTKSFEKKAIKLLNKRYGDCDFKIKKSNYYPSEAEFLGGETDAHYSFDVSTNVLDEDFYVTILEDEPDKIDDEDFLDLYYEDKYHAEHLYKYIEEKTEQACIQQLADKFKVDATLKTDLPLFMDYNFGKLPTPEDFLEYNYVSVGKIDIYFPNIITSKAQLNKDVISLTKYILNDIINITLDNVDDYTIYTFSYRGKNDKNNKDFKDEMDVYKGSVYIENKSIIKIDTGKNVTTYPIEKLITDNN